MSRHSFDKQRGFALPLALAVLLIVSAIGLGMGAAVQTETRGVIATLDGLRAAELARSGQELTAFLQTRGLGYAAEDLAGTPVEVIQSGSHYRATLPEGTVDLFLESESAKIPLLGGAREFLLRFFTLWEENPAQAEAIVSRLEAWRQGQGMTSDVTPVRTVLNLESLALIDPLSGADFRPLSTFLGNTVRLRPGLLDLVTTAPTGSGINPNFAPEFVLRSIPGLSSQNVSEILTARRTQFFKKAEDLQASVHLASDSPAWTYLRFDRGGAPAVLAVGKLTGGAIGVERRVFYNYANQNLFTGTLDQNLALAFVERDVLPEFAQ